MAESQKKFDLLTCLGCGGFSLTLTAILIADVARDIANPNSQPTEIPIPSIITNFEATDYLWVLSIPIGLGILRLIPRLRMRERKNKSSGNFNSYNSSNTPNTKNFTKETPQNYSTALGFPDGKRTIDGLNQILRNRNPDAIDGDVIDIQE